MEETMSNVWRSGDTEREVIAKLRAAQVELLLIGMEEDVSASDLRSVIEQLEVAILTIQLQR
jgi:hypothetical protein